MFSKTMQHTLINEPSNNSPYDAKLISMMIVKISSRLRLMAFSNNYVLFLFSWERDFDWQLWY